MRSHLLDQVPGISYGFGDLKNPVPFLGGQPEFLAEWNAKRPRWKQVHGIACAEVIHAAQECGEVDGLYTRARSIPIAAVSADCVPILLSRRDGRAVASAHSGWRGTRARILVALWQALKAQGEAPKDWVAAVGPAIGPCCYEVSEELADDFKREFGWSAVPSHRHLDLPLINAQILKEIGIGELELLRGCTRCARSSTLPGGQTGDDSFAFHSYRREGGGTREYSVIRID